MIIEIPGVGNVEFPDGTPPEVIQQALAKYKTAPAEEKGIGQRIKENILGDDDPTTQNFGEKVGSFLNKAGESATLGLIGDEASAGVETGFGLLGDYGNRRDHYRQQEEVLERDNPGAALTADVGGALAGAMLPLGAAGTLSRTAGMLPRMGASAATGAAMGGTYGMMEGEGLSDRLDQAQTGATIGGVVGAAAPVVGAGVQKVADSLKMNRAIRGAAKGAESTAAKRAASGREYSVFKDAGAEISPEALSRLRMALDTTLPESGLGTLPGTASRTPGGQQILNTVGQMDDQVRAAAASGQNPAVPLQSIEELRRFAGDVAQEVNPIGRPTADARMGSVAIDEIDDFVNSLQAADVPIGDPKVATEALKKARELWARASKTQLLDNVLDQQDNYLGGAASAIRNKVGSLLRNAKTARQFTEAEKVVLRKIIGGNAVSRAVRLMGNGIGRQVQMAGGAGLGGIPGAVAGMLTGELTGAVADRNAVRGAEIARALIANGGLQSLPVASDSVRRMTEALMRRSGAAVPQ